MVEPDGLDNVIVVARGGLLSGPGGAEQPVGRAFELGVVAPGRADDSGSIGGRACPEGKSMLARRSVLTAWVVAYSLLDDSRYILRKLAHTCTPKLEDDPTSGQVLLFRVSYPLGRVFVTVDSRHDGLLGDVWRSNGLCARKTKEWYSVS
jgi:hypothetical protein